MPIREEADDVIAFLNDLLVRDSAFIGDLIAQRVPCNTAIAEHPTVQVSAIDGRCEAGLLGVLNGFLGSHDSGSRKGWGPIVAIFEGADLLRFERTESPE